MLILADVEPTSLSSQLEQAYATNLDIPERDLADLAARAILPNNIWNAVGQRSRMTGGHAVAAFATGARLHGGGCNNTDVLEEDVARKAAAAVHLEGVE